MQASIYDASPKPGEIGRVVPGRASGIKMVRMAEVGGTNYCGWGSSPFGLLLYLPVLSSFCTRKSRRWRTPYNIWVSLRGHPHMPMHTGGGETQPEGSTTKS